MKRVEELIPIILGDLKRIANIGEQKILVDSDLKKHLRNTRIVLEDVSKNVRTLRTSFLNSLGYFPEGTAESLKKVQDRVSDVISQIREKEVKYFTSPKESFENIKNELSKEIEYLINEMKSL